MRLKDADELLEHVYRDKLDSRELIAKMINNAHTIEEREKGEWYKPTGMMPPEYAGAYRCSKCDELAMRDWKTHKQMLTDFCPNCGADMRKGEEG